MTAITILPEKIGAGETTYRAVAGKRDAVGRSAGEALDALTSQLSDDEAGMLVVIQNMRPDALFTAAQQRRLEELMSRWRTARDSGGSLAAQSRWNYNRWLTPNWMLRGVALRRPFVKSNDESSLP